MQTKTIRVDMDVYRELQRIAAEQNMQFSKPTDVLRWVLKLPPRK